MSDRKIVKKDKHLVLAKNTWSELEGKLFATLIKELNPKTESDFKPMEISIKDIEKLWKIKVNTTQVREVCDNLRGKGYEVPDVNDKGRIIAYNYFSLFHRIRYERDDKYIVFQFHDDMKPFLIDFANQFVNYNIENIIRFKSKYTLSFYEYFKLQTQFKKEKTIIEIVTIEDLREWLNLNKSKTNNKDKYTRTNDLKKYILEVVSKDMKKYSDVYMNFEFRKTGRKATHIIFNFSKNLSKSQREASFFDEDELENEYSKYLNKPFLLDGNILEIKVLTPMTDFYVATYINGQSGKIYDLNKLGNLIESYKE